MDRADKTSNESFISVLLRLQKEGGLPIELTDDIVMALMFVSLVPITALICFDQKEASYQAGI